MQQTFLFTDESETAKVPRRHRRSDPQTSVKGAEAAERKAGGIKGQVLSMASDVPMTANELAELAVQKFGGNRETCRKRAMELGKADDGRLRQYGTKVCSITGSEAATFILSGKSS
jgi:hypothetical protein